MRSQVPLAARQQRELQRTAASVPARTLDFRTLTQADFDAIADQLNRRPRQTLGFKTPSQALAEVLR
jgi:IS30 family transposase